MTLGILPAGEGREYHARPFNLGVYNRAQKKILANRTIPQAEIPQDGKFHLYHLGKFAIEPATILWVHWTWLLSIGVDSAYLLKAAHGVLGERAVGLIAVSPSLARAELDGALAVARATTTPMPLTSASWVTRKPSSLSMTLAMIASTAIGSICRTSSPAHLATASQSTVPAIFDPQWHT